jgi:3-methyladenine DNA glycosylase AlkD
MTVEEIMAELVLKGSPSAKKTLMKHGAREPFYGVKVGDLKPIQKKIKKDHDLAKGLYATGVSDAMYLAGLIADPMKMTKADLKKWANGAYWYMLSDYTVPWVASESKFGMELALEWIDSPKELIASCGWATLSSIVAITPDEKLDLDQLAQLLNRVEKEIGKAPNRVKYSMNGFVISAGCYVIPLLQRAKAAAKKLGTITVDMGDTECRVPLATDYIAKVESMGRVGKKRKQAAC